MISGCTQLTVKHGKVAVVMSKCKAVRCQWQQICIETKQKLQKKGEGLEIFALVWGNTALYTKMLYWNVYILQSRMNWNKSFKSISEHLRAVDHVELSSANLRSFWWRYIFWNETDLFVTIRVSNIHWTHFYLNGQRLFNLLKPSMLHTSLILCGNILIRRVKVWKQIAAMTTSAGYR